MENKKYELTDATIKTPVGEILYRIRALRDFCDVSAGDMGGFVQSEKNLSHYGDAWVYDDASVYGRAEVYGNASVYGNAQVCGNASVYGNAKMCGNAKVYGNAQVYGNAWVRDDTWVYDDAQVYGNAEVCGNAQVYGDAWIYGKAGVYGYASVYGGARVYGNASVYGNAQVYCNADWLVISPIGSRNDTVTFFRLRRSGIGVSVGCFRGTLEEFLIRVRKTHGENTHGAAYRAAAELAKIRIGGKV